MDELKRCHQLSLALEKKILESQNRWQKFTTLQTGYKSVLKFQGQTLPPPVMTAAKRRKMQMYRKQAYIAEIRLKSQSREKDFLNKIQGALDEVRDFHIDTSESSDADVRKNRPFVDVSISSSSRSADDHIDTRPHISSHTSEAKKPNKLKKVSLKHKAKSTTDLSKIGIDDVGKQATVKPVARIHRRRYNSEGRSDSDEASRPPKSSSSPCHSKRAMSNNNLLTIPFEQYQQQVEDLELSRARQRYREGRSKAMRSPSPQLLSQNAQKQSPPPRPVSTPAIINNTADDLVQPDNKLTPDNGKTRPTVSTHALKLLLDNLDPSHDQPTHHWLSSRVSDQRMEDQDDISLDTWFQNAPDSVKQKLVSLLPKVSTTTENTDDCKVVNKSVHISPVHTCNSSDDTLRSTSPLPDEDRSIISHSFTEYLPDMITSDDLPLVVIEKSPNTSPRNTPSATGTDSYNARDPSATSIDTVIEVDIQSSKSVQRDPIVPPLHLSSLEPPMSSTLVDEDFSPPECPQPEHTASERKRSLSMQSYTLEEPSEALLNSTLNDKRDSSAEDKSGSASSMLHHPVSEATDNTHAEVGSKARPDDTRADISKLKTKIPTRKSSRTLLSKCQLDTPPSPADSIPVKVSNRTPLGAAKHRQLIKLVNPLKSVERRSLTPTPPSRVLTPTPPSRPQSEMGTRSSRSRLEKKAEPSSTDEIQKKAKHIPGRKLQYGSSADKSMKNQSTHKPLTPMSMDTREKRADVGTDITPESPLKNYKNRDERISRARKQLALLKLKVSARTRGEGLEGGRSKTSLEVESRSEATRPMSSLEINGGVESRRAKSSLEIGDRKHSMVGEKRSPHKTSNGLHEQCVSAGGKENMGNEAAKAKASSKTYVEREERPISTAYSENSDMCEVSSSRSRKNVLSTSSKSNRRVSDGADTHMKMKEKPLIAPHVNRRLYGLIKGHLCRKLFGCSRVKSIVKTIQDCQTLLPSIVSVNRNSAAHDVNFQQRIRLQMSSAKEDLHDIFFKMKTYQRIGLVKQSEKVLACQRDRQARKKHEFESKWKAKDASKKCQQHVHSSKIAGSKVHSTTSRITAVF